MRIMLLFFLLCVSAAEAHAQLPICKWYAANEPAIRYDRPDEACRGFHALHPTWGGYPAGTWIFDHIQPVYPGYPGGGCVFALRTTPTSEITLYNYGAIGGTPPTCRDIGTCAVYPENTTDGCNASAHRLRTSMPLASDPRRDFHEGLACGIRTACTARCYMDNCKWLEHVSPASTDPYLLNRNLWPTKVRECNQMIETSAPTTKRERCAMKLGFYNIHKDLTDALVEYGCGTDRDWQIIWHVNFSSASECLVPQRWATRWAIREWRTYARQQCQARRTAAGLDPIINNDLRGRTCGS